MFLCIFNFPEEISSFPFYCFHLFLFIDHWGRLSNLSLLFFGTLHSNGYIFPFLLCLLHLFFSQLFIRPPRTTILPFSIYFSWGWSWSLPPVQCHEPDIAQCHEPVLRALQTLQFTRYYIFARKRVRVIRDIFPEFLWDVEPSRNLHVWAVTLNAIWFSDQLWGRFFICVAKSYGTVVALS